MRIGNHSADSNPLYYLSAFTIRSPFVQWAIEHGALVDLKPRAVNEADFGDEESRAIALKCFPGMKIGYKDVLRS